METKPQHKVQTMNHPIHRRQFGKLTAAAATVTLLGKESLAKDERPKLRKAVKFSMVRTDGSVQEKFELVKSLGFEGVELDSPSDIDRQAARDAQKATGVIIHGVIDSVHWQDRLSDPDTAIRAKGLAALEHAMEDASFYGADTVLLVPGKVDGDVSYEQCYERSQAEIRKVLPDAERLNVKIAVETVWNNFITKPEQLVQYVDDFASPFVGAYFDCSNMIKYGVSSADWIRALGKRMLKFDFKGYSNANGWVDIGEGDEDWPEVLKALAEVGYNGWATSEVKGGGEKELRDIAARMDKVLGITS